MLHCNGPGKWRSVDIWESQAAYERFLDERLMPAVREKP
jgi:hypothetical protein